MTTTETTYPPEKLREFVEKHCPDKFSDSCHDSPCRYSSHLNGCTHPLHPKNQPRGWSVPLVVLTAIDPGFTGHEDEDTLTVEHDGELVARYSRHVTIPVLIADARQHMKDRHGIALPYSVHAVAGGV